jgi:hypothetical protein
MADREFDIISSKPQFVNEDVDLADRPVRVFGSQERETASVVAQLIDQGESWWAWWRPAWATVYQDYNPSSPAWVYSVADRNPHSPIDMDDYTDLVRGDRILLRGKWLAGGPRDAMSFDVESLYRLDSDKYVALAGQSSPATRPTVTLIP